MQILARFRDAPDNQLLMLERLQTLPVGRFTLFPSVPKLPKKIGRDAQIAATAPDEHPSFRCQSCDGALLTYIKSTTGGVKPIEYWDQYVCRRCGSSFEYRRRTRQLTRSA